MNKVFIVGNLTRDPELRSTRDGISVCSFTVAVNRRVRNAEAGQPEADFFRVTAWRQLGETCARYLSKGRKISVIGEVTARAYEGKDGTVRASLEVTADEVEFLSPREQGQGYQPAQGYQSNQGGYRQSYPQQGFQGSASSQQSNGWQDNAPHSQSQNPFGGDDGSSSSFEEISDTDLPF